MPHTPTPAASAASAEHPGITESLTYIRELAERGFYGFLTLKFERGNVCHLKLEQNLRPSEVANILSGSPRKESYANITSRNSR